MLRKLYCSLPIILKRSRLQAMFLIPWTTFKRDSVKRARPGNFLSVSVPKN